MTLYINSLHFDNSDLKLKVHTLNKIDITATDHVGGVMFRFTLGLIKTLNKFRDEHSIPDTFLYLKLLIYSFIIQ
jgi:hypothetical protein